MPTEAIDADYCHALIARILEHPDRIDPVVLDQLDGAGLETERLLRMTGLLTKVRHNPIRERMPLTMRALAAAGIESEFFTAYAGEFTAKRREGVTDERRSELFVEALQRWLDPTDRAHRLVADVLAHELAVTELSRPDRRTPSRGPSGATAVDPDSRPVRREGVEILHLTVHPSDVLELVVKRQSAETLDRSQRSYAYLAAEDGPRIVALAAGIVHLLELADGSTTVATIADALGQSSADRLVTLFQMTTDEGITEVVGQ